MHDCLRSFYLFFLQTISQQIRLHEKDVNTFLQKLIDWNTHMCILSTVIPRYPRFFYPRYLSQNVTSLIMRA